jgi:HK97 family phage portal protein
MARTRKPKVEVVNIVETTTQLQNVSNTTTQLNDIGPLEELEKSVANNFNYDWSSNMGFDNDYTKQAQFFEFGNQANRRFSYAALRNIAQSPMIAAIIQTRANQIAEFATETADDNIGFEIQLKDKHRAPTEEEQRKMNELREFMKSCGSQPVDFELTFESFLRQIVRDSLIYDQANFEIIRNKKGEIVAFAPVDASTIRRSTMTQQEQAKGRRDPEGIHYIQIVNNKIVAEYKAKDLCFGIRRPRTSLELNGYGFPELEEAYQSLQNLYNAETYNASTFTNGISAAGLIAVKSKMNAKTFRAFRREFYQMLTGVNNSKRTPLIQLDPEANENIESINLSKSNQEMEYEKWVQYLMKTVCAIFQIDPAEIGFVFSAEGQTSSVFGTDPAQRVLMGQEKGLRPLVRSIEGWLNKWLINEINPAFEIKFIGLDSLSTKEKMMIKDSQLKYMTINELRQLEDLKPLEFGDALYDQVKNLSIIPDLTTNEPETQKSIQPIVEENTIWKSLDLPKIDKDFDENKAMFVVPKSVAQEAQKALDAKEEHGEKVRGGLQVGWTRARQLANQEPISYKTVKRMFSFFSRHDGNQKVAPEHKDFPWADAGFTSWRIWGSDEGFKWAKDVIAYVEDKLEELDAEENE